MVDKLSIEQLCLLGTLGGIGGLAGIERWFLLPSGTPREGTLLWWYFWPCLLDEYGEWDELVLWCLTVAADPPKFGDGSGVGGSIWCRLSPSSSGTTWAGGPIRASNTGRNTNPCSTPKIINAVRTRKKYLKYKYLDLVQCVRTALIRYQLNMNDT